MFKPTIYIKGERLDLFDNDNISVNSSAQNISDISRVFNDYSEDFSVPATPNNNKIFKHWYNFSITDGFDARVRHSAILEVQTIPFREGSIRLKNVVVLNNKPISYTLVFFGQLIELKETFGDDYLNALDFSEYDFTYTSSNILTGLTTGFSANYKIPLISTDKQYLYDSSADITNEERLTNIAWNNTGVHGIFWGSLRPALKVMRIIEKIESTYGIMFSRDFLGNAPTEELFLWMANQDTEDTLKNFTRVTDYDSVQTFQADKGAFNNSTGAYIVTDRGSGFIRAWDIRFESSDNKQYTVQAMNNDQVVQEVSGSGDLAMDISFPIGVDKGSQLYVRVVATAGKVIDYVNFRVKELSEDTVAFVERTTDINISTVTAQTKNFAPNIKIVDFLKSLFKFYNLTIEPTSETEFNVIQLDDWYEQGNTYDISGYVEDKEIPIDRPTIYKEISFNHQEPKTILASQFLKTNNTAYGDLETKLRNADGTPLDGGEYEIEVQFEQMVYEKIQDQNTGDDTNIVYGLSLDDGLGDTLPEAHLLYILEKDVSANNVGLINDVGTVEQISTTIQMPSHATSDKSCTTTFGSEIDEHTGGLLTNSIFQKYYRDYITDSFDIQRRKLSIEAKLPTQLLNGIKLNDKLIIRGDRFFINSMEVNLTTQKVKFELLNDIYENATEKTTIEEEETQEESTNEPNDPQPQARSFNISATGEPTRNGGCALIPNATKFYDGLESQPTLANTIYNDANMTTVFNGGGNYFKINGDLIISIESNGVVSDVYDCQAQANQ